MGIYNPSAGGGHIGDATDGTSGSVLFVDSSGNLAQDNSNLFWNDSNNRLGIGTPTPGYGFHYEFTGSAAALCLTNSSTLGNKNWKIAIGDPGNYDGYLKILGHNSAHQNDWVMSFVDDVTPASRSIVTPGRFIASQFGSAIQGLGDLGILAWLGTGANYNGTTRLGLNHPYGNHGITSVISAASGYPSSVAGTKFLVTDVDTKEVFSTTNQGKSQATSLSASITPLIAKAAASQTANIQEWQNSSGTVLANVDASGNINLASGKTIGYNNTLAIQFLNTQQYKFIYSGVERQRMSSLGIEQNSNYYYAWSSGGSPGSVDTALQRSAAGIVEITNGTLGSWRALRIGTPSAGTQPLMIQAAVSQTASLTEWQDSSGNTLAKIGARVTSTNATLFEINGGKQLIQQAIMKVWGYQSSYIDYAQSGTAAEGGFLSSPFHRLIGAHRTGSVDYSPAGEFVFTPTGTFHGYFSFSVQGSEGLRVYRHENRPPVCGVNSALTTAQLNIEPNWTGKVGCLIRGVVGQTANLQEWQDSAGTVMSSIGSSGNLGLNRSPVNNVPLAIKANSTSSDAFYLYNTSSVLVSDLGVTGGGHLRWRFRNGAGQTNITFNSDGVSEGLITLQSLLATSIPLYIKAHASQTANLTEWRNSSSTVLSSIDKTGAFNPVSMADSAAANNSIYYSTDASKLVYKDAGGTINNLY